MKQVAALKKNPHGVARGGGRSLAWVVGAMALVLAAAQVPAPPVERPPGQAQTALRFLRAVLRGEYGTAYGQLAPEVRRALGLSQFKARAAPLRRSGQHRGGIELYKLGVRLNEGGGSRLFYSFAFAADSGLPAPAVLLEVAFRDTAARTVLGFGLQHMRSPKQSAARTPTAAPKKDTPGRPRRQ